MIEIGMDQHKRFSQAAALNVASGELTERRLEHADEASIAAFVRSFDDAVRVTLETTGNWYWLADLVEDAGATVRLCHTLEAKRRWRGRAKTDRLDALALARLSAEDRVPEAYMPARADRDRRERHRFRSRLVGQQTMLKNWVHALLAKLNLAAPFSDAFGKGGRAYLDALSLRAPYGEHLASALRVIDALDAEIRRELGAIRATLASDRRAELLMTVPGIGELRAYLLIHEIGPIDRFWGPKAFVSYCTLAPGTAESAAWRGRPGVGREGNLYLKEAFTAAARSATGSDASLRATYNRQARKNGKKKARVAVARKLAIAVYHMLKRGQAYRASVPKTHPGVGKPAVPLGRP